MIRLVSIDIATPAPAPAPSPQTVSNFAPGTLVRVGNRIVLVFKDPMQGYKVRALIVAGAGSGLRFADTFTGGATVDEVIGTLQFHVKDE